MLLENGSRGDDVKQLQEKLGLDTDGIFGPGTESAVREWQKNNGLAVDGIVGGNTWTKLFEAGDTKEDEP
ncbi:MAG: peptidoglycan-binding protein [bacterium]|nr:peptidoglycan-binding protein [bacterium]